MRHTRRVISALGIALALALALALPLSGGCTPNEPGQPINTDTTTEEPGGAQTESETTTLEPGDEMTVMLYWVSAGENALGVTRQLPYSEAVATHAVEALIDGPTAEELTTWPALGSSIPDGTRLLGLTIADGIAKIDLSKEFESGGGTFSVTSRLAQVVYTLDQFPTIDAVEFYIEGQEVTTFSSEGLELEGPQKFDDYDLLLPIDA